MWGGTSRENLKGAKANVEVKHDKIVPWDWECVELPNTVLIRTDSQFSAPMAEMM